MTMPPGIPDAASIYIPEPAGVRELNLGDQWRARWAGDEPLPRGVLIERVYAAVMMDGKGYLCRPHGAEIWDAVEGTPGTTRGKPETFVRRLCREQVGAEPQIIELVGYLDCRATSHHPALSAGTRATMPFFMVAARLVAEKPKDTSFERRRLPLNEFGMALRQRYPEFVQYFPLLLERYVILRAKGEAI